MRSSGCSHRRWLRSSLPQRFFVLFSFLSVQWSELAHGSISSASNTSVQRNDGIKTGLSGSFWLSQPLWFAHSWCLSLFHHRWVPGMPELLQSAAVLPSEWRSRSHAFQHNLSLPLLKLSVWKHTSRWVAHSWRGLPEWKREEPGVPICW